MESSIFNVLFEYGSLGIFAGFLVWQHLSMQKRIDSLIEKFQDQLDKIQKTSQENEEKLRTRYDAVITTYQEEKTILKADVVAKIETVQSKVNEIKVTVDSNDILVRDSLLVTQRSNEILKAMEDEKRLKDIARKMHSEEK